VQYFSFRLLMSCAEYGARFPLDGPTLLATCTSCHSPIELSPKTWQPLFKLACSCGENVETFPPPPWLAARVPEIVQLFVARREGVPAVAAAASAKPVLWSCPRCAAGLDIDAESPRILTCRYCESDLYLPDPLWHACRPVRKRAPFWIAFRG
jgi:hypothetical protein